MSKHFDMLPEEAFQKDPFGRIKLYKKGGGGSSAPAQTTVQNTNLPDYVEPYVTSMLGAAQKQMFNMSAPDKSGNQTITGFKPYTPYSVNPQDYIAGFSPLQQQAQQGIANLSLPSQFYAATAGTAGAMNQLANNQYNPLASGYMATQAPSLQNYGMQNPGNVMAAQAQSAQLGGVPLAQASGFQGPANVYAQNVNAPNLQNYQMQGPADVSAMGITAPTMQGAQTSFNPNLNTFQMGPASQVSAQDFTQGDTAQRFMNPYIKQALDPQLAEIERQYGITGTQEQSQATAAGAFGGSREALMAAENQRNKNMAMNQAIGQGYNTAYQNAQQQFNAQQQANLQAQQANQQAGINVGGQNLAAQLGVQQLGTQSGLQAQLANLSNEQQAAVNNQAAQLQANGMNASQALQAALANQQSGLTTGQQNLAAQLGIQQLGAGQSLQAQQLNQAAGLQAGLANQQTGYNTALQNAQLAQQANLANQSILGQYGLQQGQMNQQTALANQQAAQQANLANQQNAYNVGAQNLAAQLGIQQLGAGQNLASQQANQNAYAQAQQLAANQQQFGANYGLQNLQQYLAGANQLGNLGTSQQNALQSILNLQNTAGTQQQTQQQDIINQAINNYAMQQQMPMQNLANLSSLLHGLPMQNTTTSMYQAAPSGISQLAGLGTGAAGIAKLANAKKGGSVKDIKKMAGGGISSLENRQRIAENYSPQLLQQEVQNGVLPQGIGGALSQDYSNMAQRAQAAQAVQAAQQAALPQDSGVSGLPSNLPVQGMAEGGIIAFADGDLVDTSTKKTKTTKGNPYGFNWDYKPIELKTDMTDQEIAQYNNPLTQKPYTPDEFTKMMNERRTGYGISDIYTAQSQDVKDRLAKLDSARESAKGIALLSAAGKMLGSTSPYWGVGIGGGLGEYATSYGAAAEKLDARAEDLAKQNSEIARAQNAMKQAWMSQDTSELSKEKENLNKALNAKQGILNQNAAAQNQGMLEKNKERNAYNEKIQSAEITSASAHNTDLRWLTQVNYENLVKKGATPGEATRAKAAELATQQIGMTAAKLSNLQANQSTVNEIALLDKINDRIKTDPNTGTKGALALAILRAKMTKDPKAIAIAEANLDEAKQKIAQQVRNEYQTLAKLSSPADNVATNPPAPVVEFNQLPSANK